MRENFKKHNDIEFSAERLSITAQCTVFFILAVSFFALFLSQTSALFEKLRPIPLMALILTGFAILTKLKCFWLWKKNNYIYIVGIFLVLGLPSSLFISASRVDSSSILILGCLILLVAPAYWYSLGVNKFSWAAAMAILASFLMIYRQDGITAFIGGNSLDRLNLSNSHPNLLGYCAMVFSGIALVLIVSGRWLARIVGAIIIVISFIIMIKASSRGSFVASSVGILSFCGFAMASVLFPKLWRKQGFAFAKLFTPLLCIIALILLGLIMAFFIPAISDRINGMLLVNDEYRGVDSGMSGRIDSWYYVWGQFSIPEFISGIGIRETERQGIIIDNSYVVMAVENGVFGMLIFLFLLLSKIYNFVFNASFNNRYMAFAFSGLLISVLANNFVARYLFGVGNIGSILALLAIGYYGGVSRPAIFIKNNFLNGS